MRAELPGGGPSPDGASLEPGACCAGMYKRVARYVISAGAGAVLLIGVGMAYASIGGH